MSNIKARDIIEYLGSLEAIVYKSEIVKGLINKETYTKDEVVKMVEISASASFVNLNVESLTEVLNSLVNKGVIE